MSSSFSAFGTWWQFTKDVAGIVLIAFLIGFIAGATSCSGPMPQQNYYDHSGGLQ